MSARRTHEGSGEKTVFPEASLWGTPPWVRIDRFRASPSKFPLRVIGGGLIGLLLGRVVGSLEGIFLQWVYGGLQAAVGSAVAASFDSVLYWIALVVGKILSPFFLLSPLSDTLHQLQTEKTGALALMLLAQLHGALNGLHQGLRPALGARLLRIIERIILPWGTLWHWFTYPFSHLLFRAPQRAVVKELLANGSDEHARKRLISLNRRGQLQGMGRRKPMWTERETLTAYQGREAEDTREQLWWVKPAFRSDVYAWIEREGAEEALPLLGKGLHDPDPGARRVAIQALASLKSAATIPYLVPLLDDDDAAVSKLAVESLKTCATLIS